MRHALFTPWFLIFAFSSCFQPQDVYPRALSELRRKNYDQALSLVLDHKDHWKKDKKTYARLCLLEGRIRLKQSNQPENHEAVTALLKETQDVDQHLVKTEHLMLQGLLATSTQRPQAEPLFHQALALAEKEQLHQQASQILLALDDLYYVLGKTEVEITLRAARFGEKAGDLYLQTKALTRVGFDRLSRGRYDEALGALEAAGEGHPFLRGALFTNSGLCYGRLGYYDKGRDRLKEAIAIFEKEGNQPYLLNALGELGNNYFFRGAYREANRFYFQAYQLADEKEKAESMALWAGNMADVSIMIKDWGEAEQWNQRAMTLTKNETSQSYCLLNQAHIAFGRRMYDEALAAFTRVLETTEGQNALRWSAHSGLARLFAEQERWPQANRHFEAAVAMVDRATDLKGREDRITYFARLIRFHHAFVDALVTQGLEERAFAVAESGRARNLPGQFSPDAPKAPKVADLLEKAERSGVVYLSYWAAPQRSFLWVFSPSGFQTIHLPGVAELTEWVEAWRRFLVDEVGDPMANPHPAGEVLYATLLAPVQPLIPDGARVVLAADGPLWRLNFETLPVPKPSPHYWIEDVTLTMAPSLSLTEGPGGIVQPQTALIMGDPLSVNPDYPALTHAAPEIRGIASGFSGPNDGDVKVLTGAHAHPKAYGESGPGDFDLISFVAHAEPNHTSPLDSAIILSASPNGAYKLYARDIINWPLKAELVSVSSCTSAGSRTYAGEGLVGFAWAFLHAGARRVAAGLWELDDMSASELMGLFHQRMAAGLSPEEALRASKLDFIHADSPHGHKPFYWGAFQIYSR